MKGTIGSLKRLDSDFIDLYYQHRIAPIPGSRKPERIAENMGAAEGRLSSNEVAALDEALENMKMSAVFGGSPVKQ